MSVAARERPRNDDLESHWVAAAVHELLLGVTGSGDTGRGESVSALLENFLHLHAPAALPMNHLFGAEAAPPVCRGCDQFQRASTRQAHWPCRTYSALARYLMSRPGVDLTAFPEGTVALFPLQSHRADRLPRRPGLERSAIRDLGSVDPS